MDEDREIIAKVLGGDYEAFEKLVEKYEGRIYRHLRKMVKDNHHAQDLLQETFLSAYKGLEGFTGASSFSTWLFRIATNTALMYLRKNRPENVEYDDEIRTQTDGLFVPASREFVNTPLDLLLSKEGRRKIEQVIDDLPVLYRSVIVLRDVEGFSLEEVSRIMDSSVAAIKSRLHRARNFVREALASYYMEREVSSDRQSASH
ncbi:MAG TPA: sigma-70 family RNA polymerase sigma factor [Desulfomonilaceae bacterium]|nr:sigma-70 family RNA polymerase sigma factor [Desulfomonilaceae bacterium]